MWFMRGENKRIQPIFIAIYLSELSFEGIGGNYQNESIT
jgi:hypothetical protein